MYTPDGYCHYLEWLAGEDGEEKPIEPKKQEDDGFPIMVQDENGRIWWE